MPLAACCEGITWTREVGVYRKHALGIRVQIKLLSYENIILNPSTPTYVSSSSVPDENRISSDARCVLPTPRCRVPPARALLSNKSSHLSSFSCDVHACPRALPSSRKVHCPAKPPASGPDEANGRRVESLPCESRLCPDDTGGKMGSKRRCLRVVLRASLPARRNTAPLTSPVGGGSILGRDLVGAWRRWWRASEGRRATKLFTTSEIENVGISGADDEGSFFLRRRFCRLGLRTGECTGTGGGGGEVATTEENEERDE
jgi:hypothetical protein